MVDNTRLTSPTLSFRAGNGWWWVPVAAPLVGGVVGALIYKVFVEMYHPSINKRGGASNEEPESEPLDQLKKAAAAEMCV